jgi:nucleoside-diphosphate-sugar epimerase
MAKILITGGAGFVGRYFTTELLQNGNEVWVVDNLYIGSGAIDPRTGWPMSSPLDFDSFYFHNMDCREFFKLFPNEHFDYVFHLAAVVGGRLTIERDPLAVATDLSIDADMWLWATKSKPGKVVFFSSSAAYPIDLQAGGDLLLEENMIDFSRNLGLPDLSYGWAKLTGEYLAKLAHERYGLNSVIYRPFSGYGPDQDLSYPFPSICKRAVESVGEEQFQVWGSGLQARDFIHIRDCVRGVLSTMNKIDDARALNLSTGKLTTFLEFARLATQQLGYSPIITGMLEMPEGVKSRGGDTKKQTEFGFTSEIRFEDGVLEGVNYFNSKI